MDLVDRDGADAFSIRALAKELEVYPTAIYHHVGDIHRLIGLIGAAWMADAIPAPDLDRPFEWLREMAHAYRRAALEHPHIARLISSRLVNDTSNFVLAELVASHLEAAGIPDDELAAAYNASVSVSVGFVDLELATAVESGTEEGVAEDLRSLDPTAYPTLARHAGRLVNRAFSLRWSSGDDVPLHDSYEYLVELMLDGLRRRAELARSS